MKTMFKNKFVYLAILCLSVMLSGAACSSDTQKDGMIMEGDKMKEDTMMKKDGMMEEGDKMKEDTMMKKDDMMEEGSKMKEDTMMK